MRDYVSVSVIQFPKLINSSFTSSILICDHLQPANIKCIAQLHYKYLTYNECWVLWILHVFYSAFLVFHVCKFNILIIKKITEEMVKLLISVSHLALFSFLFFSFFCKLCNSSDIWLAQIWSGISKYSKLI